jgi:DNA-binding beta-propeller fold protein YncE
VNCRQSSLEFIPGRRSTRILALLLALGAGACRSNGGSHLNAGGSATAAAAGEAHLPLMLVADVPLPGGATRLDYQDVDPGRGHLVIAHMNDNSVLIVDLRDGTVVKELHGIPTPRGIAVAPEVSRIFVTSSPQKLVIIDAVTLNELGRVVTGNGPDGVAWDPTHRIVAVSDQHDGAMSLIADAGNGARSQIPLGSETGNVIFDARRTWLWITVEASSPPDQLVAVDPATGKVTVKIDLPGCSGAHGLRLHPDGQTAFVACEGNSVLARVDLLRSRLGGTAATGEGPDVLAIDGGLRWIYVAAESGDLTVFDIDKPTLALVGHDHPGDNAHTVSVDPASHRVFFPLMSGPGAKPTLRIMRPTLP